MDKIGRYSIMSELGRGTEGTVYRVIDVDSQRQLALKVIKVNPDLPDDDPDLLRLIHETEEQCRKLGEIEHRNVARIFDSGFQDGNIFIAIEFIEGKTLKWFLEDTGKVQIEEAVEIAKDIAKGLKAIHALGIVMGCIKPSDIMIRPGIPVIAGFGLPCRAENEGVVRTTRVVENVIYLAPEVIEGAPPTGKSDIYSLGMLLYSMLAGGNPFEATTVANALINVRVKGFDPVDKANSKVPGWLAKVVHKAISRNPEDRYASVDEFLDDLTLRSILKEEVPPEEAGIEHEDIQYLEEVKPRRKERLVEYIQVGFVLLSFIAIIWILIYTLSPSRSTRERQNENIQALRTFAEDARAGQQSNPTEFNITDFLAGYQGGLSQAQTDLIEHFSVWIDQNRYEYSTLERLQIGQDYRDTFTVVAFPRPEFANFNLNTFAIREDLKLRVWDEGEGTLDDVTTWKIFK